MGQNSNKPPGVGDLLRLILSDAATRQGIMQSQMQDAQDIGNLFRPAIPEYPIEGQAPGYFGRGMQVRMG